MFAKAQVVRSFVLSPVCAGFDGDTFDSGGRCVCVGRCAAADAGVVVAGGCEDAGGCAAGCVVVAGCVVAAGCWSFTCCVNLWANS